ncbi:MAG: hypothetical protein C0617_07940 [Desulfuromonas sp.]|nr:MAG: hypothetical protein C0617_07940 [Desulfuromonas sp.]
MVLRASRVFPAPTAHLVTTAQGLPGESGVATQAEVLAKIAEQADGAVLTVQQGATEATTTNKLDIKDAAGNSKFVVQASGAVGIGTDTPGAAMETVSSGFPVGSFVRTTSLTGGPLSSKSGISSGYSLRTKTSGNMGDGFGGGIVLSSQDNTSSSSYTSGVMARLYARRDGGDSNGALQFFTTGYNADSPTMTLRNSGYVGIGTVDPTQMLDVSGNVKATTFIGDGSQLTNLPSGGSWGGITGSLSDQVDLKTALDAKAGVVAFSTGMNGLVPGPTSQLGNCLKDDGTWGDCGSGSSQWTMTGSDISYDIGNVGIGTDSPGAAMETVSSGFPVGSFVRTTSLTGGALSSKSGIASGYSLRTKTSGNMGDGFGGGIVLSSQDNTSSSSYTAGVMARIYARRDGGDSNGALQFFTTGDNADAPTMTLRNSGHVGIGTTAPVQMLDVNGAIKIGADPEQTTCDDSTRGTVRFVNGGLSDDAVEVCGKFGGAFLWKSIVQ